MSAIENGGAKKWRRAEGGYEIVLISTADTTKIKQLKFALANSGNHIIIHYRCTHIEVIFRWL